MKALPEQKSKFIILILVMIWTISAIGQGPPVRLTAPGTLGFQGSAFRTFGLVDSREGGNSYTQVVAVPYNFSTDFQAGIILRYSFLDPAGSVAVNGFNHTTLFLKHQIVVIDEVAKTFRLSALVRQTFPTAKAQIAPDVYSTFIGVAAGDISTRRGFYSNLGYVIRSGGFSDIFQYDLAIGVPLLPQVYPLKQLNSFLELNGTLDGDGNHGVSLSPGIQFIKGTWLLESSLQLPVVQPTNNNKRKYNLLLGTRILI